MYQKIEDILTESQDALSTKEVAEKAGITIAEAGKNLLRLKEEGKVDSVEKEGKVCWQISEGDEEATKLEKRVHRT